MTCEKFFRKIVVRPVVAERDIWTIVLRKSNRRRVWVRVCGTAHEDNT